MQQGRLFPLGNNLPFSYIAAARPLCMRAGSGMCRLISFEVFVSGYQDEVYFGEPGDALEDAKLCFGDASP